MMVKTAFADLNTEINQLDGYLEKGEISKSDYKKAKEALIKLEEIKIKREKAKKKISAKSKENFKKFEIRKFNPLASNLGHTFGHAIEKMTDYKIKHGDAISIGTIISLRFSLEKKLISQELFDYIFKMMNYLDLKTSTKIKFNKIKWVNLMLKDKKSYDDNIGLILIRDIGFPVIKNKLPFYYVKKDEMIKFLDNI